jgi:thioredoxin-like negative regulator of GroEL
VRDDGLVLLHFVASWASAICEPHRSEVAVAADALGTSVRTVDIDDEPELAMAYSILNVPAVAIEGRPESRVVGAQPAERLVAALRSDT